MERDTRISLLQYDFLIRGTDYTIPFRYNDVEEHEDFYNTLKKIRYNPNNTLHEDRNCGQCFYADMLHDLFTFNPNQGSFEYTLDIMMDDDIIMTMMIPHAKACAIMTDDERNEVLFQVSDILYSRHRVYPYTFLAASEGDQQREYMRVHNLILNNMIKFERNEPIDDNISFNNMHLFSGLNFRLVESAIPKHHMQNILTIPNIENNYNY